MSAERYIVKSGLVGEFRHGSSKKLIVFCHGYKSSSKHPALVILSKGIHQNGHSTFTFNFSGADPMDLHRQVDDLQAVVTNFRKDYDKIILLAGSFGALPAAMAASQTAVDGLITINGFFGFMRLTRIALPVLIMHARHDKIVPLAQSRRFFTRLRSPKKFVRLDHADHHLSAAAYTDKALERMAWLKNQHELRTNRFSGGGPLRTK